jgi:hypothetical protein
MSETQAEITNPLYHPTQENAHIEEPSGDINFGLFSIKSHWSIHAGSIGWGNLRGFWEHEMKIFKVDKWEPDLRF